jgi:hypothetical protein
MKMSISRTFAIAGPALFVGIVSAQANTAGFDKSMAPILEAYLKIQNTLAGDGADGVEASAKAIAKLTKKVSAKGIAGAQAKHYQALPATLHRAALALRRAKGLDKQREAFKSLSRAMALWVSISKPVGVNVVFCSMAKASWLQRDKSIRNPYYGSKMLACGQIIAGADKGHGDGHMKH